MQIWRISATSSLWKYSIRKVKAGCLVIRGATDKLIRQISHFLKKQNVWNWWIRKPPFRRRFASTFLDWESFYVHWVTPESLRQRLSSQESWKRSHARQKRHPVLSSTVASKSQGNIFTAWNKYEIDSAFETSNSEVHLAKIENALKDHLCFWQIPKLYSFLRTSAMSMYWMIWSLTWCVDLTKEIQVRRVLRTC